MQLYMHSVVLLLHSVSSQLKQKLNRSFPKLLKLNVTSNSRGIQCYWRKDMKRQTKQYIG